MNESEIKLPQELERTEATDDSVRVERVRAKIAHLRKCADEIPPYPAGGFYKRERENPAVGTLRRQAQDLEDLLEGRVDAKGNPL